MAVCGAWLDRNWGWVVTAGAFLIYLLSTGSLGVFVLLYVYYEREFMESAIAVGWVGSLANGLLNLMSLVSSPLYERYSHRKIIVLGVILCSVGILTTGFTQSLWQNYITFGVVFAVGLNFISNPSMNMISVYFPVGNNCQRAMGIAGSGQAVGTLFMSPLLEAMFSTIGWRRSLQIVAPFLLVTCLPLAMAFKPPSSQSQDEDKKDTSLKDEETKMISLEWLTEDGLTEDGNKKTISPRARGDSMTYKNLSNSSGENTDNQTKKSKPISDIRKAESCTLISPTVDALTVVDNEIPALSLSANGAETSSAELGQTGKTRGDHGETRDGKNMHKYLKLLRSRKYGWFFIATVANCIALFFNSINLVSCMTTSGIPEPTAAWLITVLNVSDFVFRIIMSLVSHSMPMTRIGALAVNAGIGAAGSFLLTRGTNAWIFVVYCINPQISRVAIKYGPEDGISVGKVFLQDAGFCRALTFTLGFSCLMEVFGISRAVETQTLLQIAYGIGAITASSVAGLNYDMTGTYQTTHYTCMGLWMGACFIYGVVWRWRTISSYWSRRNDVT